MNVSFDPSVTGQNASYGADDVGAVGPENRYEKVINLNVTKYVGALLKQKGYTVYLTRNDDTFIKVQDRTVLANEKNADLFISIHTNAVPKEKANQIDGIETFFLSPTRNERAKRVAALENKSDIREMSDSSKDVFLESLNRSRITASHKFAIDVQSGILQSVKSKYKDVNDYGVKEGPFWVLVGAQMPSILVELGYITHPTESKRLYDSSYQQLLANGIANGVDSYFAKNP
jgi:N-acetylmuramoyl-L-alanine amidase